MPNEYIMKENMKAEGNISQEFRLKDIDKKKLIHWRNELKWIDEWKVQKGLCNFKLHWTLVLASAVTGCVPIYAFASLVGISLGIVSSAVGLMFVQ